MLRTIYCVIKKVETKQYFFYIHFFGSESNFFEPAFLLWSGEGRKILKNSLGDLIPSDAYREYQNKRPEQLSVLDYIKISNNI